MMPNDKVNITRRQLAELLAAHVVDFCAAVEERLKEKQIGENDRENVGEVLDECDFQDEFLTTVENQSLVNDIETETARRKKIRGVFGSLIRGG